MSGKNNFYVYQYYDPIRNEPIYIGKGCGNRLRFHYKNNYNLLLRNRIDWIKKQGKQPIIDKLKDNLTENQSFTLEKKMIKFYGRKDLGDGPLLNLTDGGEGASGYKNITPHRLGNIPWNKGKPCREITKQKMYKKYLITFPDGHKEIILGLKKFCRKNKLSIQNMCAVANGKQKTCSEYKCKRLFKFKKRVINQEVKNKISLSHSKKEYIIIYPNNHELKIKNLTKFCRENNLQRSNLLKTLSGERKHHRNFKLKAS